MQARLSPVMDPGVQLHQEKPERLVRMISTVVEVESPVHESDITRRLMEAFGVGRAGSRITTAVEEAIRVGCRQQQFRQRDGFVYSVNGQGVQIRNRAQLEASERKIELVAPEEMDLALLETVTLGFSMASEDAVSGALSLLGFGRATAKISGVLEARLDKLTNTGRLAAVDGMLSSVV
jgi:hypothetical protein